MEERDSETCHEHTDFSHKMECATNLAVDSINFYNLSFKTSLNPLDLFQIRCESTLKPFDDEKGVSWIGEDLEHKFMIVQGRLSAPKMFQFDGDEDGNEGTWSETYDASKDSYEIHEGFCRSSLHRDLLALPSKLSDINIIRVKPSHFHYITILTVDPSFGSITCLKFVHLRQDPTLLRLLALYENGKLVLWDWVNARIISMSNFKLGSFIPISFDFDEEKGIGILGGTEDYLVAFELDANSPGSHFKNIGQRSVPSKGISTVLLRCRPKTQQLVLAASWDSALRIFSWMKPARLKPLGALKFHSETLQALTWSGEHKWIKLKGVSSPLIAAGGKDMKISFWRIYNDRSQAIAPVIVGKK